MYFNFEKINADVKAEMLEAFERTFDSKWYILGQEVKKFEEEYARFNHTRYCIGVGNGLDALHIALKVLGIGEGDEVLVPSNTYIASWLAVTYTGATPIPVEPCNDTYNLNPALLEAALTPRTKAIMPVHLYGQACEMTAIMDFAKKHNLYVVEDNAQSHAATWDGKLTGSFGHLNGTSFYPGKNLGALGDAGAITTDSEEYAEAAKMWRNYGSKVKYYNEMAGFNSRLDELQAAFFIRKTPLLRPSYQGTTNHRRALFVQTCRC
jgi:dTDP-4-amino-4,6-dideoxygalactose transaminase